MPTCLYPMRDYVASFVVPFLSLFSVVFAFLPFSEAEIASDTRQGIKKELSKFPPHLVWLPGWPILPEVLCWVTKKMGWKLVRLTVHQQTWQILAINNYIYTYTYLFQSPLALVLVPTAFAASNFSIIATFNSRHCRYNFGCAGVCSLSAEKLLFTTWLWLYPMFTAL